MMIAYGCLVLFICGILSLEGRAQEAKTNKIGLNIFLSHQEFAEEGSHSLVVPDAVSRLFIFGCGGGGGGGGGRSDRAGAGGGGGGAGGEMFEMVAPIEPGVTLEIQVGTGGAGGAVGEGGKDGSVTRIQVPGLRPIVFTGGRGGSAGGPSSGEAAPGGIATGRLAGSGGHGGRGGSLPSPQAHANDGVSGAPSWLAVGGPGGDGYRGRGGGGGGGARGPGGTGGSSEYTVNNSKGRPGAAAAQASCAGGGGGGGAESDRAAAGGAGGSGFVRLAWMDPEKLLSQSSAFKADIGRIEDRISNEVLAAVAALPESLPYAEIKKSVTNAVALRLDVLLRQIRSDLKREIICEIGDLNPNFEVGEWCAESGL